ncbi:hypothetical protein [Corynebacterium sp.]|uniref:hypothetical protein n=1 Tax=Corynebacterium sp. TaxID=1720 RepID=UPI0026DFB15B|nr:hypothetical protein [Corynebacterium sp.]MDO5512886.1 hypothetical protein [Corynebacterium sp.]
MSQPELSDQARVFREELEASLLACTGDVFPLSASDSTDGTLISIRNPRDEDSTPILIPLRVKGENERPETLLGIELEYKCYLSETHRYLTVKSSMIKVWPLAKTRGEPLFRYDFEKDAPVDVPSSHVQVHAHRDAFTHLLGHSGTQFRRAKRRAERALNQKIPAVSEFHFTTGGERFRPCLEDILESLRIEFGLSVDMQTWGPRLSKARTTWRLTQLKAAVRDSPLTAAQTLEDMFGIQIHLPDEACDRQDRLTKS